MDAMDVATEERDQPFREWVILELFGHRRLGGLLTEQQLGGASFLRIDVPGEDDQVIASQLYAPAAVYGITPTTEAIARAVARTSFEAPVQRWQLEPPREQQESPGLVAQEEGPAYCPDCGNWVNGALDCIACKADLRFVVTEKGDVQ